MPSDRRGSGLRRVVVGEAAAGLAWVLAAAALIAAFLATAAPRELAVTSTTALQRTLAGLDPAARGISVTAQWQPLSQGGPSAITPGQVTAVEREAAALMPAPLNSPPGQRWGSFATTPIAVTNPAPSAIYQIAPPTMEVSYHSDLTRHVRLIAGTLPGRVTTPHTVPVVATKAVAARFSLHPGSVVDLVSGLRLAVSGIVVPADPGAPYWTIDPLPAQPGVQNKSYWSAGLIAGPGGVAALQAGQQDQFVSGTWFLPLDIRRITAATLPALLAGINQVAGSNRLPGGVTGPGGGLQFRFAQSAAVRSSLADALSTFLGQQQATTAIGGLIVAGLLVATLVLLLICARLAADAYRPELALLRVRGGSTRQVAGRVLARASLLAGPGAAAGGVLGVLAVRGLGAPSSPWRPALAVAIAVAGALTGLVVAQHRRPALPGGERAGGDPAGGERAEAAAGRQPARRAVAEGAVIVLAAGGLATLRLTGTTPGQSGIYTTISPVLAAIAASLLAARLYPVPLRGLLRIAAARPGPVGFLGLAQAARARVSTVLPVLALVLTLTVAAFAALVAGSVAAGQETTSWQVVGADATVEAPPGAVAGVITPGVERAVAATPGVTGDAAVWTSGSGVFTAQVGGAGRTRAARLAVVDPASYAALAAHTPWGGFPAALLRQPGGSDEGRVPVLASPGLAAALGGPGHTATVNLDGAILPVSIRAVIGPTPAEPAGGSFLIVPQWAAARLDYIPGPDLLLATGPGTNSPQFATAAAAAGPGHVVTLRRQVLSGLRTAPAQAAADRVDTLGIWAAAALTLLALLVALAASAGGRSGLARRMAALGMTARQARALDLTQVLPLLAAGILGMAAAAIGLALLTGPALNLAAFAAGGEGDGPSFVSVQLQPGALLLPAAGAAVAALVIVGAQRALATRREAAPTGSQEAG
jgi:putative ABC transport system permease protein